MRCKEIRQRALEQTLEGGAIPPESPLGRHLRDCLACRSFVEQLAEVDAALRVMPLERAPVRMSQRVLEQLAPAPRPSETPFLPWMLWAPLGSLLAGVVWAYLTWLWQRWSTLSGTFTPLLESWPGQLETWLGSHQGILSVVALSIVVGILCTILGVSLGLYVGRERAPAG